MSKKVAMTQTQAGLARKGGLGLYKELQVGANASLVSFAGLEFYNLFLKDLSGLVGYGLRSFCAPLLFGASTGRIALGKGVVIRQPSRISLAATTIDDYATLDVRGSHGQLDIGSNCLIGKFTRIIAKNCSISLAPGVNISSHCRIASQSGIKIGKSPLIEKAMDLRGGVRIGDNCCIGARATILDGVTIGDNCIIGAHSLVREDGPSGSTVAGHRLG